MDFNDLILLSFIYATNKTVIDTEIKVSIKPIKSLQVAYCNELQTTKPV